MTVISSMLKRAYDVVALVAVLNLMALGGFGAVLIGSGAVNRDKLRRIVGVLRGDEAVSADRSESDTPAGKPPNTPEPGAAPSSAGGSQVDLEIMRLEGRRIQAELEQRLALNNSILLRVMTQRERFQQEQKEAGRRQQRSLEQQHAEGFKKQLDIIEALTPKVALEHLLSLPEPDEAARILLEMNTRKAKKIVESAKSGDALRRMKVILQRVRDAAPQRSVELESR